MKNKKEKLKGMKANDLFSRKYFWLLLYSLC